MPGTTTYIPELLLNRSGIKANYPVSLHSSTYHFLLTPRSESLYAGVDPSTISATTQTAYKWSFAEKKTRVDNDAIRAAREEVGAATYGRGRQSAYSADTHGGASGSSTGGRMQGPSLPSASDLVLAKEMASEQQEEERMRKRKRDRAEGRERVEDMVGPKEVGREGMLEKKRAKRENDRAFREKGDDGFEADESTLLGSGDSFKDQYVALAP